MKSRCHLRKGCKDKSRLKRQIRKNELIYLLLKASNDKKLSIRSRKSIKKMLKNPKSQSYKSLNKMLSKARKNFKNSLKGGNIKRYSIKSSNGAWGRTKIQLKKMWDRLQKLERPLKSMKNHKNFEDWLKQLKKDEKENKRKPKWSA